ncbi:hypothetical protein K435DRAFT_794145 [Dendrothele bispora CBS 962.96]|uniref:Deoxyribonuclease NucA/NucB domain-containing protein n=1 Tax=Dendrothele bispora (strain CBS 962.96) TaxID=1314807 RepID=A0A4S8MDA4_DENBC|nr:hypothetical protein K435DRAFT_794145 [Dendrothele bispora CBS 962.96]
MSKLTISIVAILASIALAQTPPPLFQLNFANYPDVCDNHCNAFTCHDLNSVTLHRDETAGDTGDDNRRRTAIGCGNNNYCPSGRDCDEFPYASTFDGGLGCYPDGFTGNAGDLVQSGTTRCVDPGQNSAHGSDLANFYSQFGVGNSDPFFVGVPTIMPVSPLCDSLATQGTLACPDESTGDYRFRTTPATPSCPARGSRRRSILSMRAGLTESNKVAIVYTDANQTMTVYGRGELGPVVGGKVWTPRSGHPDGGFTSTIIRVDG